jgi:hypothetical protein
MSCKRSVNGLIKRPRSDKVYCWCNCVYFLLPSDFQFWSSTALLFGFFSDSDCKSVQLPCYRWSFIRGECHKASWRGVKFWTVFTISVNTIPRTLPIPVYQAVQMIPQFMLKLQLSHLTNIFSKKNYFLQKREPGYFSQHVDGLRVGWPRNQGSIPAWSERIYFLLRVQTGCGGQTILLHNEYLEVCHCY